MLDVTQLLSWAQKGSQTELLNYRNLKFIITVLPCAWLKTGFVAQQSRIDLQTCRSVILKEVFKKRLGDILNEYAKKDHKLLQL